MGVAESEEIVATGGDRDRRDDAQRCQLQGQGMEKLWSFRGKN